MPCWGPDGMTTEVKITAGPCRFSGRLEEPLAPATCNLFRKMMPSYHQIIHVRWSGEGCWIPLGDLKTGLPYENATNRPAPGQFIFYPGGDSETEILLAYGLVHFASKVGQLRGNQFLTITQGLEQLPELGRLTLWHGAQEIRFEFA